MNKVELMGRLTKDVEIKTTTNQTQFCNFTLAVDRRFKDANGQRQTDFINCVAWKQTAVFIQKYFRKGSQIAVCGSIQTRSYEKDGQKQYVVEVIADEAYFCGQASAQETKTEPQAQQSEPEKVEPAGELPFEI